MKILFVAAGSPATVFALAPLATAARNAGHQVVMAANDDMMPVVASTGLPGVPTTDLPIKHFITTGRDGLPVAIPTDPVEEARFTGGWFARMALAGLPNLTALAERWRPDVVVGGTLSYVAGLLAARLGVPYVRQTWDAVDADEIHRGAAAELAPDLAELGLDRFPEPDLLIDICPPSLRPADAAPALPMRFVPVTRHSGPLEPWMYTRGARPRICVTSGSRVAKESYDRNFAFLRTLARDLAEWDTELVVAAPEAVADALRPELPGAHLGWMPLDVVAPTCDLMVHHGGGVSTLTGLAAGVPQLLIPKGAVLRVPAQRVADQGAAVALQPGEDTPEAVAAACRALLDEPSYRLRAGELAAEIAAMPDPAQLVPALEKLPHA
ncbi:nucleotide disphospho-sugar-binding domain-containing protein [Streptacidiphilus anmyonensis]|uniref:nucleotide disphospho-sugar-binding domain-containing protein n=1 Tax=Streptacidiphilus anmyonensis TaxID=405782 RepID=UPI0005A6ACDE|nr:nucleotide disphospho-sugar-binding domain-containing protein [Streptacidiphilus anmyonensis]